MAICIAWLVPAQARTQPVFSSAISVDCTVLNADVVVVGRVVDFSEVEPIENRPAHAVTIAVTETLKGENQHRRLIRYTNLENSLLAKAKGNPHQLLLVAARDDPPVEQRAAAAANLESVVVDSAGRPVVRARVDIATAAPITLENLPADMPAERARRVFALRLPADCQGLDLTSDGHAGTSVFELHDRYAQLHPIARKRHNRQ